MPAQVDKCVQSLMAKWKKDPSKRPKPREKDQDAKSQAWGICTAAFKKTQAKALEVMLEGGYGPTLIGAAATNRPYIPQLEETKVEGKEGEEKLIVHLANPGFFNHPTGAFTLNHPVFSTIIHNFDTNVLGQQAAYDCRHKPELGALGWFESLWVDQRGRLFGKVDPTPVGLEQIRNKSFLYSSMEFHRNFDRDDVKLNLEDAVEDFCFVDLEENAHLLEPEEDSEDDMNDEERIQLEQKLEEERKEREKEQERIKKLEKQLGDARDHATKLEQEAVDSSVAAVIELAQNHRDKEGKGHARPYVEWVGKVLKFEDFGEDEDVVALSEDEKPGLEMIKYLARAIKDLTLSMPGTVPAERKSKEGKGESDEDEFDFDELWDEESEGD